MPVSSGQMLSHYRLVEKIGEGGMGVVWKAEDTVLSRTVAIKVLPADVSRDDKRRQMFLDEARAASAAGAWARSTKLVIPGSAGWVAIKVLGGQFAGIDS